MKKDPYRMRPGASALTMEMCFFGLLIVKKRSITRRIISRKMNLLIVTFVRQANPRSMPAGISKSRFLLHKYNRIKARLIFRKAEWIISGHREWT